VRVRCRRANAGGPGLTERGGRCPVHFLIRLARALRGAAGSLEQAGNDHLSLPAGHRARLTVPSRWRRSLACYRGRTSCARTVHDWLMATERSTRRSCSFSGARSRAAVVLLRARTARDALAQVKQYGRHAGYEDPRKGGKIMFEFVGVIDLDEMVTDFFEHPVEVWYELRERLRPMQRRRKLLVPENRVRAVHIPSRRRGRVLV
jgi:hypothetical protein